MFKIRKDHLRIIFLMVIKDSQVWVHMKQFWHLIQNKLIQCHTTQFLSEFTSNNT